MVPVYIEGKKYIVNKSKNVLETCLSLGFDIPYFCWHPALGSVGACRQCAVKVCHDYNDNVSSQLVMACMTPITENIRIFLFEKDVLQFRKDILELLMINHPHDCPVCEEGGHCHLQDMTVMTGHAYRRYRFNKRTYLNQYLGPFIKHEMNRCITCYRCVRYYRDYAGGNDFGVFGIHDNIYFGRVQDGILQSEFSGNLIEICPTGVFTDKTQSKNYARKWDMTFAPSICQQCSVGCNIILGERYGKLCRVENRYNNKINGYFLCDRGRFGHSYININNRPKQPLQKCHDNNFYNKINVKDAVKHAVSMLKKSDKIIGIGSSRASIESNFALMHLVGSENFYAGVDSCEYDRLLLMRNILRNNELYVPSLCEIEDYDLILILGEDLTQTNARVALSVRQAVRRKFNKIAEHEKIFSWNSEAVMNFTQDIKYPLLITGVDKTKLDNLAVLTYYDSVQNQARFGFSIAHALDNIAPDVTDLDCAVNKKVNLAVQYLLYAKKPLIISGSSSGSKELIGAAVNIAYALKKRNNEVGVVFVAHDGNSMGLSMLTDNNIEDAYHIVHDNNNLFTSVIILENDLYRYMSLNKANKMLNNINFLIVLDHQHSLLHKKADLILPVANFAESDGTVINYEGRAQRFFKLYDPKFYNKDTDILESWRWLYLMRDAYTNFIREENLRIDDIIDSVIYHNPELIGIKYAAPAANFRIHGQKLAQSPHRYSGRTAATANISVHEPCLPKNDDTMFTFSMEGNHDIKSEHSQVAFAWAPGWNSPQAWNKFQEKIGENLYPEDPGIRIFGDGRNICDCIGDNIDEKSKNNQFIWFKMIPNTFLLSKNSDIWLIVPYWHLFGSEYTSQLSEYIQDCMVKPYAMISILDAKYLNIQNNMCLRFTCDKQVLCLPVQCSTHLPLRHIGLPVGFPGIPLSFSGMYASNVEGIIL